MSESRTKLYHTYPSEPPFECSTGDMTGEGFEITVDKRTHELLIPREGETEEAVTIIVRPKGGRPGSVVTAGADVPGDTAVLDGGRVLAPGPGPRGAHPAAEAVDFWQRRRGRSAELSEGRVAEDLARAAKRGVDRAAGPRPASGAPQLTLEEFRRLRWEQAGRRIVTADPSHVPLIEKFLASRNDPEKLRAFIEQDLGGEWREEPYAGQGAEEPGPVEYRARQPCECHVPDAVIPHGWME